MIATRRACVTMACALGAQATAVLMWARSGWARIAAGARRRGRIGLWTGPGSDRARASTFCTASPPAWSAQVASGSAGKEELVVHLTVLAVPGCPNAGLLEERLAGVLGSRPDVTVSRHVIADEQEAARWGMQGSPTILVDGTDPFAGPGQAASVSCRLYRDGNGRAEGAPSVSRLRQAIGEPASAMAAEASPDWLDALGRGGRGRTLRRPRPPRSSRPRTCSRARRCDRGRRTPQSRGAPRARGRPR